MAIVPPNLIRPYTILPNKIDGLEIYQIHEPEIVQSLRKCGYFCERYQGEREWATTDEYQYDTNIKISHGERCTLPNGLDIVVFGALLMTWAEHKRHKEDPHHLSTFGRHPSVPEPIGDSSDGIVPCGYEEL